MALTTARAKALLDELNVAYKRRKFQDKLRSALTVAACNTFETVRVIDEMILPVTGPIVAMYGFDASRDGVGHSLAALLAWISAEEGDDGELARKHNKMVSLLNPMLIDLPLNAKCFAAAFVERMVGVDVEREEWHIKAFQAYLECLIMYDPPSQ